MRTLFVAPQLPVPLDTGGKIRTWHLLRGVAESSKCTLLSFGGEEEARKAELPPGIEDLVLLPRPPKGPISDVGRLGLGVPLRMPIVVMRYTTPQMALAVARLSRKVDLVHFDHVHLAQYADLVQGAAMVFDAHNAEYLIAERLATQQKNFVMRMLVEREARRTRWFEGNRVRKVDLVTACSEDDARLLLDAAGGRGRVECLPNGVDLDFFGEDGEVADEGHVVLTGSMDWEPNVDAAVWLCREILPELRRRIPDCKVYLVGRKPWPQVQELASIPGVVVTGTVPDVRPYVRKARCLVVPMRVGGGTRLKILEAFAGRVPVVSTRVGYEGIAATPDKELLVAETPAEFADQIARLDRDPSLAPALADAGRALAEDRYGWGALRRRLAELHLEACRESRSRRSA